MKHGNGPPAVCPFVTPVRKLIILAVLALLIAAAYLPVLDHGFIDYDDDVYITNNVNLRQGLSLSGVRWAFTTTMASNWHPLTWISHLLDVSLFGLNPRGHHLMSLVLHGAGSIALFLALEVLTGLSWPSALVAALFAVHPLHVESVAWVSERKDLLAACFWFLTMLAYGRYARQPVLWRYALVAVSLCLGLMAKPMLVSLPLVLLLLDWWPLARIGNGSARQGATLGRLLLEKAPLVALAVMSIFVTYRVQESSRAVASLTVFPIPVRVGNALLSYAMYLLDTLWPRHLAFLYLHPGSALSWAAVAAATAFLAAGTLAVILLRKRYLQTGWLWYLVTLVPVIGLVQVGSQARADRYTYIPLVGIFIMTAWGALDLAAGRRHARYVLAVLGVAIIIFCTMATRVQVGYWKDASTLYGRAVDVEPENWLARTLLAVSLSKAGDQRRAIGQLTEALRLNPNYERAWIDLGVAYDRLGRSREAVTAYRRAIQINPRSAEARFNLGLSLAGMGDLTGAQSQYQALLAFDRSWADRLGGFLTYFPRKTP